MDFLTKTTAAKAVLQKQIDLLEARLEVRSQEKHDIINEKLEAEARLKKEKEDIINEHKEQPSYVPKKGGTP